MLLTTHHSQWSPQETQVTLVVPTPTGVVSAVGPQQRRIRSLRETKAPPHPSPNPDPNPDPKPLTLTPSPYPQPLTPKP